MSRTTNCLVSVALFCLCLICNPYLVGQKATFGDVKTSTQQTAPVAKFSSRSQLVLVTVIVTDKKGAHVSGLTRDAFKVEEQGKVREPAIFEEVKTVAPDTKRPVALDGHSNFSLSAAPNWRMTVVVIDTLNTPVLSQEIGKRKLMAYLSKSLQREEPTALFGLGRKGLTQLHPFTTDTAVLMDALKRLQVKTSPNETMEPTAAKVADVASSWEEGAGMSRGNASNLEAAKVIATFMKDTEAMKIAYQERDSISTTLGAMTQIAHAYAAIPGRKTLIWATGGFPFMLDDPQAFARLGLDMLSLYEETWRALVSADIAVYTVDVTGLVGGDTGPTTGHLDGSRPDWVRPHVPLVPPEHTGYTQSKSALDLRYDKADQRLATLRTFAEATGGLACVETNQLEKCFEHAVDDSRSYYMLGYYLPGMDQQPGWRKLKVKVNAPGVHVRSREGFYVTSVAEDTDQSRQRQMVEALRSPVEFTGVRLNVRELPAVADAKPAGSGKSSHLFSVGALGNSVTVDVQNGNLVDLTAVAVAFAADGRNAGQVQDRISGKLKQEVYERIRRTNLAMTLPPLELAPGNYEIRFAVRDNLNGEIGTVHYPIVVK